MLDNVSQKRNNMSIVLPDVNWEPVCNVDWNRLICDLPEGGPPSGDPAVFRPMDEKPERCTVSFVLDGQARGLYIHSNAGACEVYSATSSAGPYEFCGSAAGVKTTLGWYFIQLTQQVCFSPAGCSPITMECPRLINTLWRSGDAGAASG